MFIKRKNPHGGDVYSNKIEMDYSANINPRGIPESVKEAVIASLSGCVNYPDPYCTKLREKISNAEGVPIDNIICGNGSAELIYAFAFSLPKDKPALLIGPSFQEYKDALDAAGIAAEYLVLSESEGLAITDDILKEDFSKYSALFICSPNNPTGITVPSEMIKAIAQSGVRLMLDLTFMDLTDDPDKYDIPGLCKDFSNIIILRSFTKNFALAGLRLGYCLCSDADLLEKMSEQTQCWNVSTPAQEAGIAALDCKDWLKESVAEISTERAKLVKELTALGIRVYPGEANFLLLYSDAPLFELLQPLGILIRDCSNYIGLKKGFVRIAVRGKEENERLLSALKEVLK